MRPSEAPTRGRAAARSRPGPPGTSFVGQQCAEHAALEVFERDLVVLLLRIERGRDVARLREVKRSSCLDRRTPRGRRAGLRRTALAARGSNDGEDRYHGGQSHDFPHATPPSRQKPANGVTGPLRRPATWGYERGYCGRLRLPRPGLCDSLPSPPRHRIHEFRQAPRRRHPVFTTVWQPDCAERTRPLSGAGAGRRSGPRDPPLEVRDRSEVRDRDRLDLIPGLEPQDLGVERQLRLV